ncbi:MAG: DCC1-like thiol-disulfide oxidoreductase family protein [Gemmatimonadota bacterium]|nr:DCC1-like thiol-disulfide oxidoreductase family protein [Gemmatimonadota bacterium]
MNPAARDRYTVIYDGHCGVCTRLAQRLAKMDRRGVFEIVASQSAGVAARFPWISDAAFAESLQVVRNADNKTWQGAGAVEEIIGELRGGRALSWVFAFPFARALADGFYRWFARNRTNFGCRSHCDVRTR